MCSRLLGGSGEEIGPSPSRNGPEMDGRSHYEMNTPPARPVQMGPRFDAMGEVTSDGEDMSAEFLRRGREIGWQSNEIDCEGVGKAQKLKLVSRRGRKPSTGWSSHSNLA